MENSKAETKEAHPFQVRQLRKSFIGLII